MTNNRKLFEKVLHENIKLDQKNVKKLVDSMIRHQEIQSISEETNLKQKNR